MRYGERITFRVSGEIRKALNKRCKEAGITPSALIRELIKDYLAKEESHYQTNSSYHTDSQVSYTKSP